MAEKKDYLVEMDYIYDVLIKLLDGNIIRRKFPLIATILDIERLVSKEINISLGEFALFYNGKEVKRSIPLIKFLIEKGRHSVTEFEIEHVSPKGNSKMAPRLALWPRERGISDKTHAHYIVVENKAFLKEWCGAYRHKVTGVVFYNAWAQTNYRFDEKKLKGLTMFLKSKAIQTPAFPLVDAGMETDHDVGTQMWHLDLFIPNQKDKILVPYESVDTDVVQHSVAYKVSVLQTFRRRFSKLMKERKKLKIEKRRQELEEKKRRELLYSQYEYTIQTVYPIDRRGFENLYDIVNAWYEEEKSKILQRFGFKKDKICVALLFELFKKKARLIGDIEKFRIEHRDESLRKKQLKKMEKASKAMIKMYPKGNVTCAELSTCHIAKVLKEIYEKYLKTEYTKEERLEMLVDIKYFLHKFEDLDLTDSIIDLIDREIDMITMNVKYLDGLQKRVGEMLYYFLTRPELNLRGFSESDGMSAVTYRCPSCMKLKPASGYSWCSAQRPLYCTSCAWLVDRNVAVRGLGPYMRIQEKIKKSEDLSNNYIPFLIKPVEIKKLIEEIWESRSILSCERNILQLRLPKWNKDLPWSPWNCVLLTISEEVHHQESDDLSASYSNETVQTIRLNHLLARQMFAKLISLDYDRRDRERPIKRKITKEKMKELKERGDPFIRDHHFTTRLQYAKSVKFEI